MLLANAHIDRRRTLDTSLTWKVRGIKMSVLCFLILGLSQLASAQTYLSFPLLWKGQSLHFQQTDSLAVEESLTISEFRFYLHHLRLFKQGKCVFQDPTAYRLVDEKLSPSLLLSPKTIEFDSLHFFLGIDSLKQSQGIDKGDLDPQNGMYWSWQSGYILAKIEGYSPKSTARKHSITYHLGGFRNGTSEIALGFRYHAPKQGTIEIPFALDRFFEKIDLPTAPSLMQAGERNREFFNWFSRCFNPMP